jgi:hypothetical protein
MLLQSPPDEPLPVPDFRTIAGAEPSRPSPNLPDTIYLCEHRQDWYRSYLRSVGAEPLDYGEFEGFGNEDGAAQIADS